ncbi:cohesin domain-containing protein [Archaeoglobus neptunius]|uniref:cohesin domain-containing protein n=1 Tax=Archaeoglobus neptunius TaxID=2798580 RepID=UPI001928F242|nr:cohesin domain-containing protein [Archaeoglobus neptunius]
MFARLFAIILILLTVGTASALTVKLPETTGGVGSTIEVAVEVEGAKNVGSMDIVISYDPSVVEVKSVGKGELNRGLISSNSKEGVVAISLADSRGINGDGAVALIEFKALKEGESPLTIQSVKAYDVNTHVDIKVDRQDGKITVAGKEEKKSPDFEIGIAIAALVTLALRSKGKR